MTTLTQIFQNKAFQKTAVISSAVLGVLGVLSGAWQTASGDLAGLGGAASGVVLLVISGYGLRALRQSSLHCV